MKFKQTIKVTSIVLAFVLLAGFIMFIGIQFIPVDRSNPPVVSEPQWDSPQTRQLAERACFDCHSNETKWPWYSKIAPVSWLVAHDVEEGRAEVNFSEWKPGQENESKEVLLEGEMPPQKYLLIHPEAKLTEAETKALIAGLETTLGPGEEDEGKEQQVGKHDED